VMVPEAVEAARRLAVEGIAANVIHVTSPDRLFATLRARRRNQRWDAGAAPGLGDLEAILPRSERAAPIVTVQDASAHSLAFVGGIYGAPTISLGVDQFGQSGSLHDLYHQTGIDVDDIVAGAYLALEV
jgi:pyruvate dehydrogenase E1 component